MPLAHRVLVGSAKYARFMRHGWVAGRPVHHINTGPGGTEEVEVIMTKDTKHGPLNRTASEAAADANRDHLRRIQHSVKKDLRRKYEQGQHEHGGHLWRKPVLNESIAEVLDLVVYLYTLRDQIESAKAELLEIFNEPGPKQINRAYNILTFGNPEGDTL